MDTGIFFPISFSAASVLLSLPGVWRVHVDDLDGDKRNDVIAVSNTAMMDALAVVLNRSRRAHSR